MVDETQTTETALLTQTFEHWHAEFRALLEEHRRDIQSRLERIEKELDRKSDKDTVELMVTGVREDPLDGCSRRPTDDAPAMRDAIPLSCERWHVSASAAD